jgi:hypothetical protein
MLEGSSTLDPSPTLWTRKIFYTA